MDAEAAGWSESEQRLIDLKRMMANRPDLVPTLREDRSRLVC
jgi:hypothetical protein